MDHRAKYRADMCISSALLAADLEQAAAGGRSIVPAWTRAIGRDARAADALYQAHVASLLAPPLNDKNPADQ